jgi:hypothetical protein
MTEHMINSNKISNTEIKVPFNLDSSDNKKLGFNN